MREKDIYEAMNQGVLLCDEKSRILYFNSSYSRFIGYRLEEICGKPIRDIRPGAVVPDVIANGKPQESLFRVEMIRSISQMSIRSWKMDRLSAVYPLLHR